MKADLERECRKNTTNQASHPAISLGVGFVLPNPRPTEASRAPPRGAPTVDIAAQAHRAATF
jgi:hypothetical protein